MQNSFFSSTVDIQRLEGSGGTQFSIEQSDCITESHVEGYQVAEKLLERIIKRGESSELLPNPSDIWPLCGVSGSECLMVKITWSVQSGSGDHQLAGRSIHM